MNGSNNISKAIQCLILNISVGWCSNCLADLSKFEWSKVVVKVVSFPCATRAPVYEGSGVILKNGDAYSVLTSEHVLIPASMMEACFEVFNPAFGYKEMRVKKRSFSSGMAELSFTSAEELEGLEAQSDHQKIPGDDSEELAALGFPKGSSSMQVLVGGKILTQRSKRAFIPQIDNLIEATQLPVEFGMSGGVLLSRIDGSWTYSGMLSHQFLKRKSSRQTVVSNLNDQLGIDRSDIAIAIPGKNVFKWLKSAEECRQPAWIRRLDDSQTSISYASLTFKQIRFKSDYLALGGADGSGIGGENSPELKNGELIGIEITLNRSHIDRGPEAVFNRPMFQKWYEWLLRGEKLTVIQLIKDVDSRATSIQTFDQFVTLWERDGFQPLVFRGNISNFDLGHLKLTAQLRSIQESIRLLRNEHLPKALDSWLRYLSERVFMAENLTIEVSKLKDFKGSGSKLFWDRLYVDHFDLALELDKKLEELK